MIRLALALTLLLAGCNDSRRDHYAPGGAGGPGAHPAAPPLERQGFQFFVTDAGQKVSVPDIVARGSSVQYLLDEIDATVPEGQDKPWRELLGTHDVVIYLHPWHGYGKPSVDPHALISGEQSDRGRYVIASIGTLWAPFPDDGTAIPVLAHELGHVGAWIPDDCPRCKGGNTGRATLADPLRVIR